MSGVFAGLYTVDIQKQYGTEFWSNVYHVDAPDISTALTRGISIANIEKTVLSNDCTITAVRARPTGVVGAATAFSAVSIVGTLASSAVLPLEICGRVVFGNGTSHPSIKYLRACFLNSGDFLNRKQIATAALTRLATNYEGPMSGLTYLRDTKDRVITTVRTNPALGNHQLRRGAKRKKLPIVTP